MTIMTQMPLAIPIPPRLPVSSTATHGKQFSTTPSLQSVLDQKRLSNQSMRLSVSSTTSEDDDSPSTTTSTSTSLQSLLSLDSSMTCTVHSHPLDEAPNDYLTDIDNDFFNDTTMLELVQPEPLDSSSPSKQTLVKKPSFVSQLSQSLRSFATSTRRQTNELVFDIQPRLTDDKLPMMRKKQILLDLEEEHEEHHPDCELETFKITSLCHSPSCTPLPSSTAVYRNREARINSQFLRLYSHESSSRQKGLLPEISPEEEEDYMNNPALFHGTNREFALLVRQRLWNCVVLPPREDALLDQVTKSDEYIFDDEDDENDENDDNNDNNDKNNNDNANDKKTKTKNKQIMRVQSLVDIQRQVKPWITLEDETERNTSLGPRGVLSRGVQFTVKGWCNTRWIASKVET